MGDAGEMSGYPDWAPEAAALFRHGRSARDGFLRGGSLEYGNLQETVAVDPDYQYARQFFEQRGWVQLHRLMNLFLLIKFYLPQLSFGHIFEFGSYRGGTAFFMGALAQRFLPGAQVFALDTFSGMPPSDKSIDVHNAGDFGDADYDEVCAARDKFGLNNVHLVRGLFSETAGDVLRQAGTVALAHVDCDIYESVRCSYAACKPFMVDNGYVVFDDSTASTCLGATEAVERFVIVEDGLFSEQVYPHHVFRIPARLRGTPATESRSD
jgi:hypothetical protein